MYTDPGVISMIIAAVAGSILAVPMFFKNYRNKIKEWFNARRKK